MTAVDITIGHWLKRRRKAQGLSQAELAKLCNCSAATIRKIEADIRRPSALLAEQLAIHLHITSAQHDPFLKDLRTPHAAGTPTKPSESLYLGRTNVSQAPLALFGRQHLINAVRHRIVTDGCRLLTLTGPPGVGKTSLAMHAAWEMQEDFEDGVYFVSLGEVESTEVMCAKIVHALNTDERPGIGSSFQRLSAHFRDKHLLLVLDNLEQITHCGPLIAELLNECAWLYVLATSRIPLHVRRENEQPVPLLPTPEAPEPALDLESLCRRYPALALFVDRVRAVNPDLTWSPSELDAAGAICRHLNGLPLAIELIAAQCRVFTAGQLLERLELRDHHGEGISTVLDLGEGGAGDLPERQQSLRNVIGSSYTLLSNNEKRLFRNLSVFRGEFDEDVIRTFEGDHERASGVPATLHSLVSKNLVRMRQMATSGRAFSMLRVVRTFASERLIDQGEYLNEHERHARTFLGMALAAEPHLYTRSNQVWLAQLERNHDNLRAALEWFGRSGMVSEAGLQLAAALVPFWLRQEYLDEGRLLLDTILQHTNSADATSTAMPKIHNGLAHIVFMQGDMALAKAHYMLGLELSRQQANAFIIASAQTGLSFIAVAEGDCFTARQLASASLEIGRHLQNQWLLGLGHWALGESALCEGAREAGCQHLEKSLQLLTEAGDQFSISAVMERLGHAQLEGEHHADARTHLKRSLEISHAQGFHGVLASTLEQLAASMTSSAEHYDAATQLFGAASAVRNTYRIPAQAIEQPFLEHIINLTKMKLGELRFNEVWSAGQSMTLEEACAYAMVHLSTLI